MIDVIDAGIKDYREVYHLQKILLQRRRLGLIPDTLIVTEHTPVFTIGRIGSRKNLLVEGDLLKKLGIEVIETDRGGDITFHGPGQLVLYPIIDLSLRGRDIHKFIRNLEDVTIDLLSSYGISSFRIAGATGVWVKDGLKIGSIGIGVSRWITYHGLSININTPLHYFDMIIPCGLRNCRIISLNRLLNRDILMDEAKCRLIESFKGVFDTETYEKISVLDRKEAYSV